MELATISGLEREKEKKYLIYFIVTVNVQKYICIDLQLTIWFNSDAPEKRSVQWRNPLLQDSMLHDTLDQLWFLKVFLIWYPYIYKTSTGSIMVEPPFMIQSGGIFFNTLNWEKS